MTSHLSVAPSLGPTGDGVGNGLFLLVAAIGLMFAIQIYFAVRAVRTDHEVSPVISEQEAATRAVESATGGIVESMVRALATSGDHSEKVRQDLRQLESAFSHLRKALDARDAELDRLRVGYEAVVAKRMMGRVVRAAQAVDAMRRANPANAPLADAATLLGDALADAGIEPFEPKPGADFRASADMEDGPQIVPTDDPEKDYRLAHVVRPGFAMQQADGTTLIISKAKVAIYKLQEQPV